MVHVGSRAPSIVFDDTAPAETKEWRWVLSTSLSNVETQVNRFYFDLELIQFAAAQERKASEKSEYNTSEILRAWMRTAARDGALAIADLEDALNGVNGGINALAPGEAKSVQPSAFALLNKYFPDRRTMRDAAAHTALIHKNPKQHGVHSHSGNYSGGGIEISGNVTGVTISEGFYNDEFRMTFKGQIVMYKVNGDTLRQLEEIKNAMFATIPDKLIRRE
jgi:hypothetical protein